MIAQKRNSIVDFINNGNKSLFFLVFLLIVICFNDLVSPPLATTIWRQTQTAMITDNFVKEGFSLNGLYVGLKGSQPFMMAYEFPVYNFIAGLFFQLFNNNPFWAKLISLICAAITLIVFYRLVKYITNNSIAFFASLLLVLLPVDVLMFTAVQPDSLGVMLMVLAIYILNKWRATFKLRLFLIYTICLLLCGLCKFPILIPYIPILALMYLFPAGKFRFPDIAELLILTTFFLVPFIAWYLYRSHLTDSLILSVEHPGVFLLGDLRRFLSLSYYARPGFMLLITSWCVIGIIYLISGLRKLSLTELTLFIGFPLYYILIPTAADQSYYIFSLSPIMTFFMAKGLINTASYLENHRLFFVNYVLGASFLLFSVFGMSYILRKDKVMVPLSAEVQKITKPSDLIFCINMHDKGVWVGGFNPSVVYFTKRNGWNIQHFKPDNFNNTISEINAKQNEGAKWLILTWYTPNLEPWYTAYLPKQFSRRPEFDSKAIADKLKQYYKEVSSGDNFSVLKLSQ